MKWFRIYSEIKDDPKMLELDDHQFRVWMHLLCMASENEPRGVIHGARPRGMAAALHSDETRLADALKLFDELEMIDYDETTRSITILHWNERQYDKPSDTPVATRERKRRSRESHANVTPSHATEKTRLDTETDLDTDSEKKREDVRATAVAVVTDTPYAVFADFLEEIGTDEADISPGWKSKQLAIAKRLLEQGYSAAMVRACTRYMRSQSWRTTPFDLIGVEKFIGTWEANGKPERDTARAPNGRHKNQPDYRGIDEFSEQMDAIEAEERRRGS